MKTMKIEELSLLPQKTYRSQATDPVTVAEYAGLMERGVTFPPLTIAEVGKAKAQVLVGGAHRLAAAIKAKLTELPVTIVACKASIDAEVLAFTDNVSHGLTLTVEDKRKAILALIQTPSFKKLSNAAIAKRLGVSDMTIKRYRDAIGTKSPQAAKSGHKNKPAKAVSTEPKVDKGGVVKPQTSAKPNAAWNIREGGSWSGGGAEYVAQAIVERVTEGVGRRSTATWNERCAYLETIGQQLIEWAAKNKAEAQAA